MDGVLGSVNPKWIAFVESVSWRGLSGCKNSKPGRDVLGGEWRERDQLVDLWAGGGQFDQAAQTPSRAAYSAFGAGP